MVTCHEKHEYVYEYNNGIRSLHTYCAHEYDGLSTDTKPTDALNGDVFFEMDTAKVYKFNEVTHQWIEL